MFPDFLARFKVNANDKNILSGSRLCVFWIGRKAKVAWQKTIVSSSLKVEAKMILNAR